ncbi:MAG TPA: amidohydrolase family protein [Myxococcota bacterium]|nr:amidohydrolase family protein [Myxococcota bacterium]
MWLLFACTSPSDDSPSPTDDSSAPDDSEVVHESRDSDSSPDSEAEPVEVPEGSTVLGGVRVVDVLGVREDMDIVLVGDLIWDVVPTESWTGDATVVPLTGLTVIPGLIDSHVHLSYGGAAWDVGPTVEEDLSATLSWGVTAVVDAGGPEWTWSLRDRVNAGELSGPRMLAAGPFLTTDGSHPCELAPSDICAFVDDADADATRLMDGGADFVKVALTETGIDRSWPRLDLGDLADITSVAPSLVHVASGEDLEDAIANGAPRIAHVPFADVITADQAAGASLIASTRGASEGLPRTLSADLDDGGYQHVEEATLETWRWVQDHPASYQDWADADEAWTVMHAQNLATLVAAEAPLLPGSDAGYYFVPHGVALHWELEALVEAGMDELDVLVAATDGAAQAWGWDDLGQVAAGYRADLVVLAADPLEDISNTQTLVLVYQGGEVVGADVWQSAGGPFCLDDRDCSSGVCDLVDHVCAEACDEPYATTGWCDEDTWCMPQDGLSTTTEGVCHEDSCSWSDQDCEPDYYGYNCVPADVDTSYCWPSGDRGAFETCDYSTSLCEKGLFCSWFTWRCYELCTPGDACSPGNGVCHQEYTDGGEPWFGLCY